MQLFDAKLDDYELRILDITDTISKALVKHEFINTDGAKIQDMGNRPREIKFKCFFYGTDVQSFQRAANYINHIEFLKLIGDNQTHVLQHPKYGRIIGYVESTTIVHDDTQDYVAIDVTFVEDGLGVGIISNVGDLASALTKLQVQLLNAEMVKMASEMTALGHSGLLGKVLETGKTVLANFNKVVGKVRDFAKSCDTFISKMDNFMSGVEQPFKSITTSLNIIGDLPSTILSRVQLTNDRIVGSAQTLVNLPVQLLNNTILGVTSLKTNITDDATGFFTRHLYTICAGQVAVTAAQILQDDETTRSSVKIQEQKKSFDATGARTNNAVLSDILSVTDIETIAYAARDQIQLAIDLDRDNQQLKDMANAIIIFIDGIKLNKLSIVNMTVNSLPLHMICNITGQPYNTAERILKLNPQLKNPTFADGVIRVYAR